jgi:hypothetical protein
MAARLAVSPCPPRATRLVLKHGACPDCHENFLQNFPGMASGSFQGTRPRLSFRTRRRPHGDRFERTRQHGQRPTAPRTTTLSFATNPSGLTLTFNGANATAPFTRTVIVGSANSASAPSPQQLRGKQYFRSWSDGVTTPTRAIVAPASGAAYTANFSKR